MFVLETLSTIKLADLLQRNLAGTDRVLRVYLQVNTSGEDSKSGVEPLTPSSDASSPLAVLALHVAEKCPNLRVAGLMTSHAAGENPDFIALKTNRTLLAKILNVQEASLDLSMGMSADFAEAIKEGSSSVRVGTRIFGARPKKQ